MDYVNHPFLFGILLGIASVATIASGVFIGILLAYNHLGL